MTWRMIEVGFCTIGFVENDNFCLFLDSLLEEFDRCPPLFMPAAQFRLNLDYQPPGEGFQLFVEELRKLCLTRSGKWYCVGL